MEGERRHFQGGNAQGLLVGNGHRGGHAGQHIRRGIQPGGGGIAGHVAHGPGDQVDVVDLRFDIQPQRNDGHGAGESLVHLLHVVFIHAQVHLQLGKVHDLHQALAAAEPIALGHGDLVHGAVDARLEGFAIGQIQDFIPCLYRLVLGNIDVAHGGLAAVLQRFGMYGADLRIEAHGGCNVPCLCGIAGIDGFLRPCRHGINIAVSRQAHRRNHRQQRHPLCPLPYPALSAPHVLLPSRPARHVFSITRKPF